MAAFREGRMIGFLLFSLLLLFPYALCNPLDFEMDETDEDSDGCTPCDPGTFYNPDSFSNHSQDKCFGCSEGECFSSKCYPCPNGTSQELPGQSSCSNCPDNYVSQGGTQCEPCGAGSQPDIYNTSCEACLPGWFNNVTEGGGICLSCLAGSYSPNSSVCLPCVGGSYNEEPNQKVCQFCGPGRYNPRPGSSTSAACLDCNPGTSCKSEANLAPVVCPDNTYCPLRSAQPLPCGWLTSSHVGASQCEYKLVFYIVVGFLSFIGFILIVVGVVFFLRWRAPTVVSPDTAELIPQSLPGPVYSGY